MSLQIKPQTMLAVVQKAMQSDPSKYCDEFLEKHDGFTNRSLITVAAGLASLFVEDDDDMDSLMVHTTVISSAMFMTYEMANAELEAKELEDLFDA